MKPVTVEKLVHLGFFQDDRARCGAKSMSRSSSVAIVSCMRCLTVCATTKPDPAREEAITLRVSVSNERRAVATHLATITGKTLDGYLLGVLERAIDELRLPL